MLFVCMLETRLFLRDLQLEALLRDLRGRQPGAHRGVQRQRRRELQRPALQHGARAGKVEEKSEEKPLKPMKSDENPIESHAKRT